MSRKVDLYDSAYGNYESATYRQVRIETYGEDFGQRKNLMQSPNCWV